MRLLSLHVGGSSLRAEVDGRRSGRDATAARERHSDDGGRVDHGRQSKFRSSCRPSREPGGGVVIGLQPAHRCEGLTPRRTRGGGFGAVVAAGASSGLIYKALLSSASYRPTKQCQST